MSAPDNLDTYAGLIATVIDEMKDSSLEAKVPRFIYLAEAQFDRLLYGSGDEVISTSTITASDVATAIPSDLKQLLSLSIPGDSATVLAQLSPDDLAAAYANAAVGVPEAYALIDGSFRWGPVPDADYELSCTYVAGIQKLADANPTNWLLQAHPDLYLYGALRQAELYGWNDERARVFDQFIDSIIAEIRRAEALKRRGSFHATVAGSYF